MTPSTPSTQEDVDQLNEGAIVLNRLLDYLTTVEGAIAGGIVELIIIGIGYTITIGIQQLEIQSYSPWTQIAFTWISVLSLALLLIIILKTIQSYGRFSQYITTLESLIASGIIQLLIVGIAYTISVAIKGFGADHYDSWIQVMFIWCAIVGACLILFLLLLLVRYYRKRSQTNYQKIIHLSKTGQMKLDNKNSEESVEKVLLLGHSSNSGSNSYVKRTNHQFSTSSTRFNGKSFACNEEI